MPEPTRPERPAARGCRAMACLVSALLIGGAAHAQPSGQDATGADGMGGPAEFHTPREALSTQAEAPYQFARRIVDESHPQWPRYRWAIRRHPDTLSCLTRKVRNDPAPDLLAAFDWQGMWFEADLEVCVFRVFASLGSIEHARDWMAAAGLDAGPVRDQPLSRSYDRITQGYLPWERAREVPALRGYVLGPLFGRFVEPTFMFTATARADGSVNSFSIVPLTK